MALSNNQQVVDLIRSAERIRCSTHVDPDADGLGCCFAVRDALRGLGKPCEVVLQGPVPASFWLVPEDYDPTATIQSGDLLLVFDVTERERLGSRFTPEALAGVRIVNFDHHVSNTLFGDVNLIDVDASSSCEVALDLLRSIGAPLTPEIANQLLLGLIFDTQGFHTASTNARSLRSGATLVEAGGQLGELIRRSYRNLPATRMQLWGAIAARGRREGPVFWSTVDEAILAEFDARPDDIDGTVNFLSVIGDVDVIVLFKCLERDTVKVSVRSSDRFDAAALCGEFGGGGHRRAAGCSLSGARDESIRRFLAAVRDRLSATTHAG